MEKQMSKNEEKTTRTEYLDVVQDNRTGEWIISDGGIDYRSAPIPAKTKTNRRSAR
jgi:hypothetical protein